MHAAKLRPWMTRAASEMTYIVSGGALNSTHSLTHSRTNQEGDMRCASGRLCCFWRVSLSQSISDKYKWWICEPIFDTSCILLWPAG